jgi:glycosyltransferase involved in cell wall biosynthesis
MASLRERGQTGAVLILVGDSQGRGGYVAELEDAIRGHGLDDQVILAGPCDDMPAAYLAADIALAPSLKPEAFGRTAVEPQLMGRIAIAADHGATRETVLPGETGWLAEPGDVRAWADAIGQAIDAGPERRAAMGAAGMVRARALYAVTAMTDATFDVYRSMLADGTPAKES